jgi:hypothetical protein
MTNRELIEHLLTLDPEAEVAVVFWDSDEGRCCNSINSVVEAEGHYLSDTRHIELLTSGA